MKTYNIFRWRWPQASLLGFQRMIFSFALFAMVLVESEENYANNQEINLSLCKRISLLLVIDRKDLLTQNRTICQMLITDIVCVASAKHYDKKWIKKCASTLLITNYLHYVRCRCAAPAVLLLCAQVCPLLFALLLLLYGRCCSLCACADLLSTSYAFASLSVRRLLWRCFPLCWL